MCIPTIRKTPLKLTKRGYVRQIGRRTKGGSVQKFYLGSDVVTAAQRRKWIETIYVENCRLYRHDLWSETYLELARQIERLGSAVVVATEYPELANWGKPDFSFVQRLRELGVPISIQGHATATVTLVENVTPENKPASTKLHQAIKRYQKDRIENYNGGFQGAKTEEKRIEKFLEIEDCWLYQFDHSKIKKFVDYWRSRPETKRGTPCSKTYSEDTISEFFKFVKLAEVWYPAEFTCPSLDTIDRSVRTIASDHVSNGIKEHFWTPAELKEVFKTAQPLSKLIIGLGLNACSGAAELGRIRVDDFHFNQQHPKSKIIGCDLKADWLITTRRKKWTHSEALLWPWVAELVKEQIAVCKKHGWVYLFTENGEPLYRDNDMYQELGLELPNTTKPESRFVKRYDLAVSLALNHNRITEKKSIGKLRKTFSNFLTMENHADLASLALSHKTDEDSLLKHYSNKPYRRLFEATKEAEEYWKLI